MVGGLCSAIKLVGWQFEFDAAASGPWSEICIYVCVMQRYLRSTRVRYHWVPMYFVQRSDLPITLRQLDLHTPA